MRQGLTIFVLTTAGIFGGVGLVLGILQANLVICAGAAIGLCYVGACFAPLIRGPSVPVSSNAGGNRGTSADHSQPSDEPVGDDSDDRGNRPGTLAKANAMGRYALLVQPQVAAELTVSQHKKALATLKKSMTLVPAGPVLMRQACETLAAGDEADERRVLQVPAIYLDRYCVTNRQFRAFLVDGGYQRCNFWDPGIWPAVVNFVDLTGCNGPRFWVEGSYLRGEDHHPVVGVSWFEVAAYACWAGKRLPNDAEWLRAAAWPVAMGNKLPVQRKYPWGDVMDRRRANLWGSATGGTVAVNAIPEGASAGGAYQMCGNVWEWTSEEYAIETPLGDDLEMLSAMKTIRGGAFDTYFENQAANHFGSGENPLARAANIGFRCALSACDVAEETDDSRSADVAADQPPTPSLCTEQRT